MNLSGWLQIGLFIALLLCAVKPVGVYMAKVFAGERTPLDPLLGPVERLVYKICGVDADQEMPWTSYTINMLLFSFFGMFVLYAVLRLQHLLPLNPEHFSGMDPGLAFNTSASFVTNTNWQAYSGESTLSYLSQMAGLGWQNFVSAATGLAMAIALIRGLTRKTAKEIGNFWVDLTRSVLYVLLPVCLVFALVLVSQGAIQNLSPYTAVRTVEGARQVIAQGPVASQEAIKELGTNGGGFFSANSAHPFENPTPLTDLLEMLGIFLLPAGLTYTFGRFAKNQRQGWALFAAMFLLFFASVSVMYWSEGRGNPIIANAGVNQVSSQQQPGGNMEGKEMRFGIANSSLWATVTSDTSAGAVNSMHDSFTPLAGGMAMANIALGEVVFGGVGVGLLGIIVFAILSVFIAGLMVGRTPEYLGKKIEAKEMKMAMLAVLIFAAGVLGISAVAAVTKAGLSGRLNMGPHGLSEILYAASSAAGNNGSAFAGLTVNSVFYELLLGVAMIIGRFFFIIPVMAIAGSMAGKNSVPESSGTFPTTGILFVGLLVGIIVIIGALTFFPAYALGPIVEHLLMNAGKVF